MDTMSAKNFLQNTEVKFKVKMIATIIPAAIFLITILIEGITGTGIQIMQNIYLISGLILLVATGAVVKYLGSLYGTSQCESVSVIFSGF